MHINTSSTDPARAGLIISKSIGGSVARHRLARKIRHCLHDHYGQLPTGSLLVIRGLNKSATANCQIEIAEVVSSLIKKTQERASKK